MKEKEGDLGKLLTKPNLKDQGQKRRMELEPRKDLENITKAGDHLQKPLGCKSTLGGHQTETKLMSMT